MARTALGISVSLDTPKLAGQVANANKTIGGLGSAIKGIGVASIAAGTAIGNLAAGAVGKMASAVASSITSFKDLVVGQFETIDAMAKLGDRFGLTQKEMAGFRLAADLAGTSIESVANAIARMQRTIGNASSGIKASADALKSLGLSASQFNGKTAAESYGMIADALNQVDSMAVRAKLSQEIFGRGAMEMASLLLGGSAAIEDAAAKTRLYGTAVDEIDVARIEVANDAWTLVREAAAGVASIVAVKLALAIQGVADIFLDYVMPNAGKAMDWIIVKTKAVATFIENAVSVVTFAWNSFFAAVKIGIGEVGKRVGFLIGKLGELQKATSFGMVGQGQADFGMDLWRTMDALSQEGRQEFADAARGIAIDFASDGFTQWLDESKKKSDALAESIAASRGKVRDLNKEAMALEDMAEEPKAEKAAKLASERAGKATSMRSKSELAGGLVAGSATAANIINRAGSQDTTQKQLLTIGQQQLQRAIETGQNIRRMAQSLDEFIKTGPQYEVVQF